MERRIDLTGRLGEGPPDELERGRSVKSAGVQEQRRRAEARRRVAGQLVRAVAGKREVAAQHAEAATADGAEDLIGRTGVRQREKDGYGTKRYKE